MLKTAKLVSLFLGMSTFRLLHIIFLAAFLCLSLASPDVSAQVTLAWDANTSPGIAGYKVYYGTSSGSYQLAVDVGNTTTYAASGLQSGLTYYFAVADYDTSGDQSGYSNQVSYSVPAAACTDSISPTSKSMGSSGGTGAVSVTAASGCSWTAVSNASWIIVTSNSSGTGNGTVSYSVTENSSTKSQSGTITIAGTTFTVSETAASSTRRRR